MGDLMIDWEKASEHGGKIKTCAEELQGLLSDIKGINESLKDMWEGQDSIKYANAVEEQANVIQKLVDSIDSTGKYLEDVARAYQGAEEANASGING